MITIRHTNVNRCGNYTELQKRPLLESESSQLTQVSTFPRLLTAALFCSTVRLSILLGRATHRQGASPSHAVPLQGSVPSGLLLVGHLAADGSNLLSDHLGPACPSYALLACIDLIQPC